MHFCYYQNTKSRGKFPICALIAFELMFVCVLFVVKENSKLWEVSLRWYEFPLMPYCNPDKVLSLKKKIKIKTSLMTVSFMTLFYSMVNGKKYNSYTIYDLYIVIIAAYFCPLQDKNMSTCEKCCQHARWLSTCKIIMLIMLTSY